MRAGDALGLLAGLGALNALGGGRNGTGKRFTGLMDMLDGGGAGASGDRFEGGGLLSALGNLFAKPLEAQDNVERIAADTNATKAVTKTLEDMAKGGSLTSRLDGKDFPMQYSGRGNVGMPRSGMEYSGRGNAAMPSAASDYPNMSMPAVEGYSTPAATQGTPDGLLSGNQAVPAMTNYNPTVPEMARGIAAGDQFSPVFSQDYADYLEYLYTGRYPRG